MAESSEDTIDVTQYLKDCAANKLSEQDPYVADMATFSFHDAMSATQLFDPKLDCCEIPGERIASWNTPGVPVFPRPIPMCLDDPMSPLPWNDGLTMSQVRTISLQILVRLHSLLKGSAVGDSCFTCLYAHYDVLDDMARKLFQADDQQQSLVDSLEKLSLEFAEENPEEGLAQWTVFATTLGLVIVTEKIRTIVQNADIYEEEDFTVATHGLRFFSMADPMAHAKVLAFVERKLASAPGLQGQHRIPLLILRFISSFYSACLSLEQISTDYNVQSLTNTKHAVQQASKALSEMKRLLENETLDENEEQSALVQQCFDPFVARPLVGNLPVRAYSIETPLKAISDLSSIISAFTDHVCEVFEKGISLGRIQRMLSFMGGSNILSRSLILTNFYSAEKLLGQHNFETLISEHLQHLFSTKLEPEPWLSSNDGKAFVKRMAKPIYDVLRLSLLNQNRLRAHLELFLLPEWAIVQKEAQIVDYQHQLKHGSTFPHFTHFVLTVVVKLMDLFVASGIQDGLVSCNHTDLWFHLWYRDFLLSTLYQHLSMIQQAKELTVVDRKEAPAPSPKRGKKKNKHKNGKMKDETTGPDPEDLENSFQLKVIALRRNICRKTIHFLAALSKAGILEEKQYDFTSTENIYEIRFEIFGCIHQPPRLSYQQFQDGTDFTNVSLDDFPTYIAEGFQNCRASIDQLLIERGRLDPSWCGVAEDELKAFRKVCIGNAVYAQKLAQMVTVGEASSSQAELDFSAHGEFCIIKLTAPTNNSNTAATT